MPTKHAPDIRDFSSLSIPKINIIDFLPGVKLHLLDNGVQPANRISVYFSRGTSAPELRVASALMPSLMQEGTKTMSGAEIAETIDFNGAFLRPISSTHFSGLSLISLNEYSEQLIPLIGDMLVSPTFPQKAFEATRQKAVMNRRLDLSKPRFIANQALMRKLFGQKHPYALASSIDDIERITLDDVRLSHSMSRQTPVHIFAAGKLSDDIIKAIECLAQRLQPKSINAIAPIIPASPEVPIHTTIRSQTAIEQAAIVCGKPTITRTHPDYDELRHTIVALGGYFGSRLMTNIREEKGLTYGISASLMGAHEGGSIQISAQCDNTYTTQVIDEIANEMRILGNTLMSEDELRRVKADITSNLASKLNSPFSIIDYYETNLTVGIPDGYFSRQFNSIRDLTPERLKQIAATYLDPSELNVIAVTAP